jgi:hypothetical protein
LALKQPSKEALRRPAVPTGLHEDIDGVTVLIDSAPQILLPAPDVDD